MALDTNRNLYVAGGAYLAVELAATDGHEVWSIYGYTNSYNFNSGGIALDNTRNAYVIGTLFDMANAADYGLIKYSANGHQLWVIRYNGPANGDDGGSSIAVAPDGAIYVTGYSANTSGGSDITTIKYAALTAIQKKSDGSIQLQCFGSPGSNYVVQAATNLLNWADLGSALADTNGLFQFLDTNAPLFPQRFYRWHVP